MGLPISGWNGDNLLSKSTNMGWWNGMDVKLSKTSSVHVDCLKDALNDFVQPAVRDPEKDMRLPLSGVYKIKGVGDVLTGRVEQGSVKPGEEVKFLPTHTDSTSCTGKVFTVEMHHKRVDAGMSGDNIGMNVKALNKDNMPRVGDVMCTSPMRPSRSPRTSPARCRSLTFPERSSADIRPLATCDAAVPRAVWCRLTGRWARTPVARRLRVPSL